MAEGCYKPRYLQASFKGVTFDAEETTSEHGRRGAEGEFPFGENTAYQDMGRKIRRYTITGRIATNNHIDITDALISVCEAPGPGLLVHPTRGAINAACTRLSVKDDPLTEQGYTRVDLEFVEASLFATGGLGAGLMSLAAGALFTALSGSFSRTYRMDAVSYYDVDAVISTSAGAVDAIRTEYKRTIPKQKGTARWYALSAMDAVIADPAQMRSAAAAYEAFDRATKTLANASTGEEKYAYFKTIANKMAKVSPLPGAAAEAQDAVYSTVRIMAAVNMARAAMEITLSTLDDALKQYDAVVEVIDQEIAAARVLCDHALFLELRRLQTDIKTSLLTKAYRLPALIEYDFNGGVHSLVAAYEIYGDARRFSELEARNPLSWPFNMGPKIIAARL